MVLVDTAMCAWAGEVELAYYGIGAAAQVPILLVCLGMLTGTVMLTAQADGAGRRGECGATLKVGLLHALVLGLLALCVCLFGETLLLATGQTSELARNGGEVLRQFSWGLPGTLLFSTVVFFLEAIHRPIPGLIIMVLANIVNAILNWVFIYGGPWLDPMGGAGAALATSAARWFMFAAVFGYLILRVDRMRFGLTGQPVAYGAVGRRFRRIGYPMALGQGLEALSFATLAMFAGWISISAVAAWTISMNMLATVFMFSLGLTTAAGVRVANAHGSDDPVGAYRAGWVAVGLTAVLISALAVAIYVWRNDVVMFYLSSGTITAAATATLVVAALAMIPDGLQVVLIGALRGLMDFWPATILQVSSFWLIMVPLAYWFAIEQKGDAVDLMTAVGVGVTAATISLVARFEWVSRHRRLSTAG